MNTTKTRISKHNFAKKLILFSGFLLFLFALPQMTFAHCDSYDGPVIKDALKALKQNKVELVLKWIEPKYEKEITAKFNQTRKLSGSNQEINKILETHFLETLVRLHREGEGEPYTGLKPAGSVTPLIQMADNSLEKKDVETLVKVVNSHLGETLKTRYEKVMALSKTKDQSVENGRDYVAAYVAYTHTLEGLEHMLHSTPHQEAAGQTKHH
jgi:hypothetical protein